MQTTKILWQPWPRLEPTVKPIKLENGKYQNVLIMVECCEVTPVYKFNQINNFGNLQICTYSQSECAPYLTLLFELIIWLLWQRKLEFTFIVRSKESPQTCQKQI